MRAHAFIVLVCLGCDGGGLAEGWRDTPAGRGVRVRWDLNADPLPELPLPNDFATWADPTSPTGLRVNVSLVAPTGFERHTRALFDQLDGWGTYSPITIPFEGHIDTYELLRRQGGGGDAFGEDRWPEHAIYVVDMETGEPIPLDVNSGNFGYVLDRPSNYWRHDPRAGESNLLFETVDEDINGNGELDPGEDTDFDGVLDRPNTFNGRASDPIDTVDEMTWFYERETRTLFLKPILPMRPKHRYAVVVTNRLVGNDGQPVQSPFDHVHHVSQYEALEPLEGLLAAHPEIYGDLARRGWDEIAMAWTFTTQSVTDELDTIRRGLYGEGSMARLEEEFPPRYVPAPMQGGRGCEAVTDRLYIAEAEPFLDSLSIAAGAALGLTAEQTEIVLSTYSNLSHVAVAFFETPFFLGDPMTTGLEDTFDVDYQSGAARIDSEIISMLLFIPKETRGHRQPFPVAFYVHGYGSASAEPLPFAGYMLKHGIAAAALNAEGHGVPLDPLLLNGLRAFFSNNCLGPAAEAVLAGRAEDQNDDRVPDSGIDFWTAYVFHTRDAVRQTVIDHMRAIQLLRSFDGRPAQSAAYPPIADDPLVYDGDTYGYEGPDIAGDFDADGTPDVGGPDNLYLFTGGSLGGIVSGIAAGAEPSLAVAAPIVGAGGLIDVAARTDNGGVLNAMHLRLIGPLLVTDPRERRSDDDSSCDQDEISLYFVGAAGNERGEVEVGCVESSLLDEDDVLRVFNAANGESYCAGATAAQAASYRVSFAADAGDLLFIEIYEDAAEQFDYGTCDPGGLTPTEVIETWQVGAEDCSGCAQLWQRAWSVGDTLVSPFTGFGRRRQTPNLRRLLYLAQMAAEPADPINYARRVLLEPFGTEDAPAHPTNLFVVNSVGDQNVPVSAGNAYARAAGILPFMPPDAPDIFRDWRAPDWFETQYAPTQTPNDLLIDFHVIEGVDRLGRHPIAGAENFLFDVDDVSEGRLRFEADGRHQSTDPNALQAPRLNPPLRWVRRSHAQASPGEDVWSVRSNEDISGLLNNYAIPAGVHGFDELVYDPSLPWHTSQYVINLIARFGATGGRDIRYHSDPAGHQCLEDSSCSFLINE